MIRVGITGGIGSGKSCVSDLFRLHGVPVFDCDSEARAVVSSPEMADRLRQVTGMDFFVSGVLQKDVMAEYLFASDANARKINSLIHPEVRRIYREWCDNERRNGSRMCAVESAILIESGMRDDVDCLLVVDAPLKLRMERVVARDHTSKEKVMARIEAQMSQYDKISAADYVIVNDGDYASLAEKTDMVIETLWKDNSLLNQ